MRGKFSVEIIPAAFTDHHAVALRLTIQDPIVQRRLRRWRIDPTVMRDDVIKRKIYDKWMQRGSRKRRYPDLAMLWERFAKKQLQRFMRTGEIEKNRNFLHVENNLYECLYDIIRSVIPETDKFLEI
jgi:hypothetical protein